MNEKLRALYQRVCAYSPDDPESSFPFTHRLARENGWTRDYAGRVVEEYKRFMFLVATAGHEVTPSEEVDQAWHLHLVYTGNYFCGKVLGQRVHHAPTKGGRTEADRFRSQYEQTLASYEEWFQERPPRDIWPATEARFAAATESVWVNQSTAWIIPKPWGARWTARPSSRLVGAGVAPLVLGAANPLDLTGPEFLSFYAVICAIGIGVALILRHLLRQDERIEEDARLSPYEIACLARGVPGVLQSGLAAMVADGRLCVIEIPPTRWNPISLGKPRFRVKADQPSTSSDPVEGALTREAFQPEGIDPGDLLKSAKPAAETIERHMQEKGLLESTESFHAARWCAGSLQAAVQPTTACRVR